MDQLPEEAARQVKIVNVAPADDTSNRFDMWLSVTIRNDSAFDLPASGAFPVQLSYRVFDPSSGRVIEAEGYHTPLAGPLLSGEERTCRMRVRRPDLGPVIVRATLVQEYVFWFDEISKEHPFDLALPKAMLDPLWSGDVKKHVFSPHAELNFNGFNKKIKSNNAYRPIMLICETVNICNHHCIICAYDNQTRQKKQMPMDMFQAVLDQYVEMGGGNLSLTPMVGDIFMDKLLLDRLQLIERYRPSIRHLSVTTNAGFVKKYSDDELSYLLNRFDTVSISVYGIDSEEFLAMTKRNTYNDTLAGIDRILRFAVNRVKINFRCLKDRSDAELKAWFAAFPHSQTSKANVSFGTNNRSYANWGVLDTGISLPFGATWIKPPTEPKKHQCGIPLLAMQVYSNGNVSFCACDDFDNNDELFLGNVMETSLLEMFNSEKARQLWDWKAYGVPAFCNQCTFFASLESVVRTPDVFDDPLVCVGG